MLRALAAWAIAISTSGCGAGQSGSDSGTSPGPGSDRSAPSETVLADSIFVAYRENSEKGYNDAVERGYAGSNVSVRGVSCSELGGSQYSCTIRITIDEPGMSPGAGVPSEVVFPVAVDSQGCWVARRNDQYADQTTFNGCIQ